MLGLFGAGRCGRGRSGNGVQLVLVGDAGDAGHTSDDVLLLEAAPPPQIGSVVEHVVRIGIERPIRSFARFLVVARHFHETFVQTQIVADRILPTYEKNFNFF